jgi:hypothetical protein
LTVEKAPSALSVALIIVLKVVHAQEEGARAKRTSLQVSQLFYSMWAFSLVGSKESHLVEHHDRPRSGLQFWIDMSTQREN